MSAFFCVGLPCVGRDLAMDRFSDQTVLPKVYNDSYFQKLIVNKNKAEA
jgi:hypothetical protein